MRECGTCTKCCEGYLRANIKGHEMSPGVPCFLLQIGKGCSEYETRPEDPCKSFNCHWMKNPEVPDRLKPEISGVILSEQEIDGIRFLSMHKAPDEPNADDLTWFLMYAIRKQLNAAWESNTRKYWIGGTDFVQAMNKEFLV